MSSRVCPCGYQCVRTRRRVPVCVGSARAQGRTAWAQHDAHWGPGPAGPERGLGSRDLPRTARTLCSLSLPDSPSRGPARPHPGLVHTNRRTWAQAPHPLPAHPGPPMASPDTSHKGHSVVLRPRNSARLCPEKAALGEGRAPQLRGLSRRVGGGGQPALLRVPVHSRGLPGPAAAQQLPLEALWGPCRPSDVGPGLPVCVSGPRAMRRGHRSGTGPPPGVTARDWVLGQPASPARSLQTLLAPRPAPRGLGRPAGSRPASAVPCCALPPEGTGGPTSEACPWGRGARRAPRWAWEPSMLTTPARPGLAAGHLPLSTACLGTAATRGTWPEARVSCQEEGKARTGRGAPSGVHSGTSARLCSRATQPWWRPSTNPAHRGPPAATSTSRGDGAQRGDLPQVILEGQTGRTTPRPLHHP